MSELIGKKIFLRALEPEDLEFLFALENDSSLWEVSNTSTPFSKHILRQYLDNSHRDIYDVKQLRLVICSREDERQLGFVDLYDFDPKHKRAGLGIAILSAGDKRKGFASEALAVLAKYVFKHLDLHQIFATITEDNKGSLLLFEGAGFQRSGVKKDWIYSEGKFKDELFYQLFRPA